jgi:prepilin-type N-terminal cleavage/methylation domain-containing protein
VSRADVRGSQRGFTLIEIITVLAIAAIVSMLAVPSFFSMMPRLHLGGDTRTLGNRIAMARASAIAKGGDYGVAFNTSSDRYSLGVFIYDSGPGTWDFSSFADNDTSRNVDLYKVATWDPDPVPAGTETDATMMAFRAVGDIGTRLAVDDPGFVPLDFDQAWRLYLKTRDDAYRKRVVMKAAGRIYVERWSGSDWVED